MENTKTMIFKIDEDTHQCVKALAFFFNISMAEVAREALTDLLTKYEEDLNGYNKHPGRVKGNQPMGMLEDSAQPQKPG